MEAQRLIEKLTTMIEKSKEDKQLLKAFKNLSVRGQEFELAAEFRDIENKHFPESEEHKQAKIDAANLNLLFRMVELTVPNDVAWLVANTLKCHKSKKGKFSLEDAVKLQAKRKQFFGED